MEAVRRMENVFPIPPAARYLLTDRFVVGYLFRPRGALFARREGYSRPALPRFGQGAGGEKAAAYNVLVVYGAEKFRKANGGGIAYCILQA